MVRLRALLVVSAAVALGATLAPRAHAQDPGEEAEDTLYRPSPPGTGGEAEPEAEPETEPDAGRDRRAPRGPAPTATEAWGARDAIALLGGGLVVLGTPARYGDADGPALGGGVAWRRFFDSGEGATRLFSELSMGVWQAGFTNDRADLEDLQPSAGSLTGELTTDSAYVLAMGRLGAEIWRSPALRLTGWLGAGVGVERRSLDFLAPSGVAWDDTYHRSVAAGEAGVGLEVRLGAVGLELRVTALALLGDVTPLGSGLGGGVALGVRW